MNSGLASTLIDVRQWSTSIARTENVGFPALVIGIGEFGKAALHSLQLESQIRTGLSSIVPFWATSTGWVTTWPDRPSSEEYPEPDLWLKEHAEPGIHHLRQGIVQAWRAARSDVTVEQPELNTLDIYILANLQERFGRDLLKPVIAACRQAHSTFSDYVFTLILTLDSLTLPQLEPGEARQIAASLDVIAKELVVSSDESEPPGRIGWCYLLDSLDTQALPLKPLKDREDRVLDVPDLHADIAAAYISLLVTGLRHVPAYERTSVVNIRRAFRERPLTSWASSISVGSYVLPIKAIAESACNDLAYHILADIVVGKDQPGDLPMARKIRSRWLAECTLSPTELRNRIGRDLGGQPLEFAVEPPSLNILPDEYIINQLLNWDTLLWQRWNRSDSPKERIAHNAKTVVEETSTWLSCELEKLVQTVPGGARIGLLFIGEAERALEDERQKPEEGRSPKTREHWLKALLAPLLSRNPDPTALPDLEASRRRLEKALKGRLNRRAIWVRSSIFAVALTSFSWAAYNICGPAIERNLLKITAWGDTLIRWLQTIPSPSIGLFLLAFLSWLITLSACGIYLYIREIAIHRAIDRMICDIRQKYSALMERTLLDEREQVYAYLQVNLSDWVRAVEARCTVLDEAVDHLANRKENTSVSISILTEKALLSVSEWSTLFPDVSQAELHIYGENFLNLRNRPKWTEESTEHLLLSLHTFTEEVLAEWVEQLDLETWITRPESVHSIQSLLDELRRFIRPAWPFSREERSEITANLKRATPFIHLDTNISPILSKNFVGLPSRGNGEKAILPAIYPHEEIFYAGDPGRLAYIATLHAMDLKHLPIWETIKVIANESPDSRSKSELQVEKVEKI